jgi:hypothetical protein
MKQIHTDIDRTFWNTLFAETKDWPPEKRNMASICRYALLELWASKIEDPKRVIKVAPAPLGSKHVQVRTSDAYEEAAWAELAKEFPPQSQNILMLRTALAQLLADLS